MTPTLQPFAWYATVADAPDVKDTVTQLGDIIAYVFVRLLVAVLGVIPHELRIKLFTFLFRLAFEFVPRMKHTIDRNLSVAFPDKDATWRRDIRRRNAVEMARLLADTVRLPKITPEWGSEHIEIPVFEHYRQRLNEDPSRGILIATGHLGSFELLGHAIGLRGYPLAAVARKFKSKRFDSWWTGLREARGNKIIDRRGAFKEVVATLSRGTSAAVLFDQNVTRNHAVFVNWFGVPAATTKSVALAALRTQVPIFVASIRYLGTDRYRVEALECDCSDVYGNEGLSTDEKVGIITQRLADVYCDMIRNFPEGWFWLHRRWKTRPDPSESKFYL
jgi:KDO2-lipid IV(A) lauroyltransferase